MYLSYRTCKIAADYFSAIISPIMSFRKDVFGLRCTCGTAALGCGIGSFLANNQYQKPAVAFLLLAEVALHAPNTGTQQARFWLAEIEASKTWAVGMTRAMRPSVYKMNYSTFSLPSHHLGSGIAKLEPKINLGKIR